MKGHHCSLANYYERVRTCTNPVSGLETQTLRFENNKPYNVIRNVL